MEENIREAMTAAHDNMQEKMQEKVAEVKNTLDSLEGTSRANRFTVTGYTIYNAVLLVCYLAEVIKGSRTGGYFAIFAALSILPLAAIWIEYKRNPASENLKRILIYSYAVFYTFTIFTTVSPVAFVYGALVSLFVIVYGEKRLSFGAAGGIFLLNLIHVIYMAANGMITPQDLPNVEIRIGFTLLFALFMVMATNVIISNNEAKMKAITQEKESVSAMLEQILEISENMIGDILTVSEKMTFFHEGEHFILALASDDDEFPWLAVLCGRCPHACAEDFSHIYFGDRVALEESDTSSLEDHVVHTISTFHLTRVHIS